eukprot:scaffold32689_cov46-Attheya_sp.AAC.2
MVASRTSSASPRDTAKRTEDGMSHLQGKRSSTSMNRSEVEEGAMRQESHRVYLQHLAPHASSGGVLRPSTASAAIRLTDAARTVDVTTLLRKKFGLPSGPHAEKDVLVLVGTLRGSPRNYIQFEHELLSIDPHTSPETVTPSLSTGSITNTQPPHGSPSTGANANNKRLTDSEHSQQQQPQQRFLIGPWAPGGGSRRRLLGAASTTTTETNGSASSSVKSSLHGGEGNVSPVSSELVNVVRTLRSTENPLAVRDSLLKHLLERQADANTHSMDDTLQPMDPPFIRWFLVPDHPSQDVLQQNAKIASIPACIDVEGYCTGMEDSDSDETNDSEENEQINIDREGNNDLDIINKLKRMDLLQNENDAISRRWKYECHMLSILARHEAAAPEQYGGAMLSGYLLKQSNSDPHVWRRVHCVLLDDQIWYISRMRPIKKKDGLSQSSRIGRHGKISLSRCLLLEPSEGGNDDMALSRTPHALELVSANGISHVFRATSRNIQRRWIRSISDRISECHENNFLELAELIVSEETQARHQRLQDLVIQPMLPLSQSNPATTITTSNGWSRTGKGAEQADVMRFGMEVANFKELCRHVKHVIPQESRVVVADATTNTNNHRTALRRAEQLRQNLTIDDTVQAMILHAWKCATDLFGKSTVLVQTISSASKNDTITDIYDGIEQVIVAHIQGQQRQLQEAKQRADMKAIVDGLHGVGNADQNKSQDTASSSSTRMKAPATPPATDLFDKLLRTLQTETRRNDEWNYMDDGAEATKDNPLKASHAIKTS